MSHTKRLTLQRKFSNLSVAILQELNDYLVDDFVRSQDGDRWEQSLVRTLSRRRNAASTCKYELLLCLSELISELILFLV